MPTTACSRASPRGPGRPGRRRHDAQACHEREPDEGGGREVDPAAQRAGDRDGRERRQQRDRRDAPRAARRRPDVVLAVPSCPRDGQPPGPDADRALDGVDPDTRAERRLARGRVLHDAREVPGPAAGLVDDGRRPADGADDEGDRDGAGEAAAPRQHEARDADGEHAEHRRQEREVRLDHEACDEHRHRQEPVPPARERPAQEDQEQEREQRRRGVPDVVERLRGQRGAHERDRDGGHEHERPAAAGACERHRREDGGDVDDPHRHRHRRGAADAHGHGEQPVEHRAEIGAGRPSRGRPSSTGRRAADGG